MKTFRRNLTCAVCLLSLGLIIPGCAEEPPTPVGFDVLDDLKELEKEAQKEKLAANLAAANRKADVERATRPKTDGSLPKEGVFVVEFETTAGSFTVTVDRSWAPIGADRFYNLVKDGFYNDTGFFRVVPDFMVQFGIAAEPGMTARWNDSIIDDPVVKSNKRGYITFAKTGAPNSRTSQVFINFKDNAFLDDQGFAPFGEVTAGMDVVDKINPQHGESPDQSSIESMGNDYLKNSFPGLDFITTARLIVDDQSSPEPTESIEPTDSTDPEDNK